MLEFDAPRREEEHPESGDQLVEPSFIPWRVFINHISSYHGKKLADFLPEREYVNPQSGTTEGLLNEEDEKVEEEEAEGEDASEDEKAYDAEESKDASPRKYEVIGTTLDREYHCPEDVKMIIRDTEDRQALLSELMKCGIIIYDITHDQSAVEEARWALKAIVRELEKIEKKAPKAFKRNQQVRHFVLISTVMTWALTKPLSPEEPDLPFTEADYRKRKPHPNFKEHIDCEKEVVIVKKRTNLTEKLKTVVICCGITYGDEEGPLHHLFKMAWKNAEYLPVFGKGDNKIPLLHVRDLITIVFMVLQDWPSLRYILAVEPQVLSQNAIVKKISKALTTGKVKNIPMEEAFLLPEVTQHTYDLMTLHLNVDPVYIVDKMDWHLEMPFSGSINEIIKEYKSSRNLRPVKIIVLGPPASGKTMVAQYLAKHYDIHYIHVKSLITNTIQKLSLEIEASLSMAKEGQAEDKGGDDDRVDVDDEYLEEEEEVVSVEELKEQLDEIRKNLHKNDGRLDDVILNKLFLRRLQSKDCANQGYVIDGYPKTLDQAKVLFDQKNWDEEEDEEEDAEENTEVNDPSNTFISIMPELVVVLEASDDFLKERIIARPEKEIQNTHYTEEHMIRRLKEYRKRNVDENTPLQFFDEIEIHPLIIAIENDVCPEMFPTIYQCLERIGEPRNYGLTSEEANEVRKRAEAEAYAAETAEKLQREREILERKRQREEKMMEWTNLMELLKQEEEERLCILGQPLRHYLMKYVFPTLTQGLIEVANIRPEDPIDFLAEYLFKENPTGKMFEPDYTETMSMLLDMIGKLQDDIIPQEELDKEVTTFLKRDGETSDADIIKECDTGICSNCKTTPVRTTSVSHEEIETFDEEGEFFFGAE